MKWEMRARIEESSLRGDSAPLKKEISIKMFKVDWSVTHLSVELLGVGLPVRLCQSGVLYCAVSTWKSRGRQGSPEGRSSPGTGRFSRPPPPSPPPLSRSLPAAPAQMWKHWSCQHCLSSNLHCLNPHLKEPKERCPGCKAHNCVGLALIDQEEDHAIYQNKI